MILSSEASLGSMGRVYEEAPSRISLLSDKFIKNCDKKIIISLREPISWIESIYSQQIHQGLTPNIDDFIKKACSAKYFHYKNLLDLIFSFIDKKNVMIIPYTDIVVKDILKEIGFSRNYVNSYKLKNKAIFL